MKLILGVIVLLCSVALISCGGGNSSNTTTNGSNQGNPTPSSAEGVYSGATSKGLTFEAIILPSQMFYAVYGTGTGNVFYAQGLIVGQGSSTNGQYSASITDYNYTGLATSGSVSATYVAATSINGTLTESGLSETFNGNVIPSSSFNYNSAAQLSSIVGQWSGTLQDGTSAIIKVSSDGSFTGSDSGCSFYGTITPDSSNKNFYKVSLTFGGSPCLKPNQAASGIAVYYLLSDGVTHQMLAGVTSGSFGTIFIGNR